MLNKANVKKFVCLLILLIMAIPLVSCKSSTNLFSEEPNYNNVYDHTFWVDGQSLFFDEVGLFYSKVYMSINGKKQTIVSDDKIREKSGSGFLGEYQAYGNWVYFWYNKDSGEREFYRYAVKDETVEKLLTVGYQVEHWAIIDDVLVYSSYFSTDDILRNRLSLHSYNLIQDLSVEIAYPIVEFGVVGKEVRYISSESNKNQLYRYDIVTNEKSYLCEFEGTPKEGWFLYNFTEDSVIFVDDLVKVINVDTGICMSFPFGETVDHISCFGQYAFIATKNSVCRMDLSNGKTENLYSGLEDCRSVFAIDEEKVVCMDYTRNWLQQVKSKIYVFSIHEEPTVILES